jgi:hypothetical protein
MPSLTMVMTMISLQQHLWRATDLEKNVLDGWFPTHPPFLPFYNLILILFMAPW